MMMMTFMMLLLVVLVVVVVMTMKWLLQGVRKVNHFTAAPPTTSWSALAWSNVCLLLLLLTMTVQISMTESSSFVQLIVGRLHGQTLSVLIHDPVFIRKWRGPFDHHQRLPLCHYGQASSWTWTHFLSSPRRKREDDRGDGGLGKIWSNDLALLATMTLPPIDHQFLKLSALSPSLPPGTSWTLETMIPPLKMV